MTKPNNTHSTSDPLQQVHEFSCPLATTYGIPAALLIGFFANRIPAVQKARKDNKGYFISLQGLTAHYPYLKRSTIADALNNLRNQGVLSVANHNKLKYDRTLWYSFANPKVQASANQDPLRFKVQDAVTYGVLEAILLANLKYWFKKNRKTDPHYTWHRVSSEALAKHLPCSAATIKRALNRLVAAGVLESKQNASLDRACEYKLVNLENSESAKSHTEQAKLDAEPADPHAQSSMSHADQAKPDTQQTKSYDNTTLKDYIGKTSLERFRWEETVEKNTFINAPASPAPVCEYFSLSSPTPPNDQNLITSSQKPAMSGGADHSPVSVSKPVADGITNKSSNPFETPCYKFVTSGSSSVSPASEEDRLKSVIAGSLDSTPPAANTLRPVPPLFQKRFTVEQWNDLGKYERESFVLEAREKQRQEFLKHLAQLKLKEYEERVKQFASPYVAQEKQPQLTVEQKVRTLKAALKSRLSVGGWDSNRDQSYPIQLTFSQKGLALARKFFELNPDVCVQALLEIMDMCYERCLYIPEEHGEYDVVFHLRRSRDLTFLLKNLQVVCNQLEYEALPAHVVYLDDDHETKPNANEPPYDPSSENQ